MEVYLLRHGEAGNRIPVSSKDRERSLTAAGKETIQKVGRAMADADLKFDVVATSPLRRAKDSASIICKELRRKDGPEEWQELAPEGDKAAFYRRLSKLKPDSSVLCIGHEPYLTSAIGQVIGRGDQGPVRIVLKKGGLARLSVTGFNPKITGELRWLLTPKQARRLG